LIQLGGTNCLWYHNPGQKEREIKFVPSISSDYDTELSPTDERGKTKSGAKKPQVRRLIWKGRERVHKKAKLFLWEWIFTVSSGTSGQGQRMWSPIFRWKGRALSERGVFGVSSVRVS
jgi:hypothetical protein